MNSEELIEYFKKVYNLFVWNSRMPVEWNANRFKVQTTYIYIFNISGLRNYTNYIEVRISVEYANHVYMFCARVSELWNIYEPNLFIRESIMRNCQKFFLSCKLRTAIESDRITIVTVTLKNAIISFNDCRPD